MGKLIGIDLGTTNFGGRGDGGAPPRHPQPGRESHHPFGGRLHQGGRDPRGPGRQAPGRHESREHHLLDQAIHGPSLRRGAVRDQARALQGHQGAQRRRADRDPRQAVLAARDLGDDPAQAEGGRRGPPGREGHPGRHHGAGLLQRQPASGHQGCRQDRRPGSPAHYQRADGRVAGVRARQEERRADRSVRPRRRDVRHLHSRSARASSRSRPPTATPIWEATTSTSG